MGPAELRAAAIPINARDLSRPENGSPRMTATIGLLYGTGTRSFSSSNQFRTMLIAEGSAQAAFRSGIRIPPRPSKTVLRCQ